MRVPDISHTMLSGGYWEVLQVYADCQQVEVALYTIILLLSTPSTAAVFYVLLQLNFTCALNTIRIQGLQGKSFQSKR
jgi:hypothetical protein